MSAPYTWQVAARSVLLDDPVLAGTITGVLDDVPEGQPYPYVVTGEATEIPDNTHDSTGSEFDVTYHVWSTYHGWAEALRIAARLRWVLEHVDLALTGHRLVACRYLQTTTVGDPDRDLRHVVVRLNVTTEQLDQP